MEQFMNQPESVMTYLNVDDIYPHKDNPRKDLGDLTELAESIKANGIFQNLTVVPNGNKYTVIIGHRRLAAAKLAGLEKVPCVIASLSPQEQFRTMMIENIQRSDLTNLEQADGFQMMLDLGDTKDMISEKTGFSKQTINKRLKLREFDRGKIIAAEERGGSLEDYQKLSAIEDKAKQNELLDLIGTSDFNNRLEAAKREQAKEKDKKRILEEVTRWAEPLKDSSDRWNGKYERIAEYELCKNPPCIVKKPKGDDGFKYFASGYSVEVYTKKKAAPKPTKTKEQAEYERWSKETAKNLNAISDRHKQLRLDFVKGLSESRLVKEKKHIYIMAEASEMFYGAFEGYSKYYTTDTIDELCGIKYSKSRYNATDEEKEEARNKIKKEPVKTMLYEIVAGFEDSTSSFWEPTVGGGFRKNARRCKALEHYYGFLTDLGYEMSEEEEKSIDGRLIEEIMRTEPTKPEVKR